MKVYNFVYDLLYSKTIMLAGALAALDGSQSICVRHLLNAVYLVDPSLFNLLFGRVFVLPHYFKSMTDVQEAEKIADAEVKQFAVSTNQYLSVYGGYMEQAITVIGAEIPVGVLHIALALLLAPGFETLDFLASNGIVPNAAEYQKMIKSSAQKMAMEKFQNVLKAQANMLYVSNEKVSKYLTDNCFGQEEAIASLSTQILRHQLQYGQNQRPLSILVLGKSGTGKNTLAQQLQDSMSQYMNIEPTKIIDFSRFTQENTYLDLVGRDTSWKDGGQQGVLTAAADSNPKGLIIIDNVDSGHPTALSYLETALVSGELLDSHTRRRVSFRDNIVLLVTSAGQAFLDSNYVKNAQQKGEKIDQNSLIDGMGEKAAKMAGVMRSVNSTLILKEHSRQSLIPIVTRNVQSAVRRFKDSQGITCKIPINQYVDFLLETLPNFESAKNLETVISNMIDSEIQAGINRKNFQLRDIDTICVKVDPIPDPNIGEIKGVPGSREWKNNRSEKRIRHCLRLTYKAEARTRQRRLTIHFTDLAYQFFPTATQSSLIKVFSPVDNPMTLIGVDFAIQRLEELAQDLVSSKDGIVTTSSGILLYGPPGTGKSSIVREFARKHNRLVISMTGADFSKLKPGEALDTIRELFATARKMDAVMFIDELDGLGSRDLGSMEANQTIIAFLTEMDGLNKGEQKTLIIGATNRPEAIDEALQRAGRFSIRLELGNMYSVEDRQELIAQMLRRNNAVISSNASAFLLEASEGRSPALLIEMVTEACRQARSKQFRFVLKSPSQDEIIKDEIVPDEIIQEEAVQEEAVQAGADAPCQTDGAQKTKWFVTTEIIKIARQNVARGGQTTKGIKLSKAERKRAAIHFGGHACAAFINNVPFIQVSIDEACPAAIGELELRPEIGLRTETDLYRGINILLGGQVADRIYETDKVVDDDWAKATQLALQVAVAKSSDVSCKGTLSPGADNSQYLMDKFGSQTDEILQEQLDYVSGQFEKYRDLVHAVINRLYDKSTMTRADFQRIFSGLNCNPNGSYTN